MPIKLSSLIQREAAQTVDVDINVGEEEITYNFLPFERIDYRAAMEIISLLEKISQKPKKGKPANDLGMFEAFGEICQKLAAFLPEEQRESFKDLKLDLIEIQALVGVVLNGEGSDQSTVGESSASPA